MTHVLISPSPWLWADGIRARPLHYQRCVTASAMQLHSQHPTPPSAASWLRRPAYRHAHCSRCPPLIFIMPKSTPPVPITTTDALRLHFAMPTKNSRDMECFSHMPSAYPYLGCSLSYCLDEPIRQLLGSFRSYIHILQINIRIWPYMEDIPCD